jgi:hypothetical protein
LQEASFVQRCVMTPLILLSMSMMQEPNFSLKVSPLQLLNFEVTPCVLPSDTQY